MMKPKYSQNHLMWPATPFFVDKQRQGFPEALQLKIKRLLHKFQLQNGSQEGSIICRAISFLKALHLFWFSLHCFLHSYLPVLRWLIHQELNHCKKSRETKRRGWNLFRIWNHPKFFQLFYLGGQLTTFWVQQITFTFFGLISKKWQVLCKLLRWRRQVS